MNTSATDERPLVHRPRQARAILGVGETKFWAIVKDGHLDVRKMGRCTLVTDESIRTFLANLPAAKR